MICHWSGDWSDRQSVTRRITRCWYICSTEHTERVCRRGYKLVPRMRSPIERVHEKCNRQLRPCLSLSQVRCVACRSCLVIICDRYGNEIEAEQRGGVKRRKDFNERRVLISEWSIRDDRENSRRVRVTFGQARLHIFRFSEVK